MDKTKSLFRALGIFFFVVTLPVLWPSLGMFKLMELKDTHHSGYYSPIETFGFGSSIVVLALIQVILVLLSLSYLVAALF